MHKPILLVFTGCIFLASGFSAEKRVAMKDLPEPVQKAVQEQTKGLELKGLSKEVEDGKTFYEAETKVNGKSRDILFDPTGAVVEVEEEIALDAVPAPAKATIESHAKGGKITKVESVTKGSVMGYEATISKSGKKSEVAVASDGTVKK